MLIVFQVSPIDRWSMIAKIGFVRRVSALSNTSVVLIVLRSAIEDQMIGKAIGGGCHHGRSLFLKTGSCLLADGLLLLSGEKTRLRRDMNSMKIATIPFDSTLFDTDRDAVILRLSGSLLSPKSCNRCMKPTIKVSCIVVAER